MTIFIPSFLSNMGHEPVQPMPGFILIYNPENRSFRLSDGRWCLQWLDDRIPQYTRYKDSWRPYRKVLNWVRVAKEIAQHFGMHLEQTDPTFQGHPRFVLRSP